MDNMTNRGYSAKIIDCSKELTAREKIRAKDMADVIALDEETKAGDVQIEVDYYLTVQVHNDKADRKDYTKYVIFGKDGNPFHTLLLQAVKSPLHLEHRFLAVQTRVTEQLLVPFGIEHAGL